MIEQQTDEPRERDTLLPAKHAAQPSFRTWSFLFAMVCSLVVLSALFCLGARVMKTVSATYSLKSSNSEVISKRVVMYYPAKDIIADIALLNDGLNAQNKQETEPVSLTHIVLSSLHLKQLEDASYMVTMSDDDEVDWMDEKREIVRALQKENGIKVLLMLAEDDSYSLPNLFNDWDALYPALLRSIEDWHADGLDIDVKDGVMDDHYRGMTRLIDALRQDLGHDFIVTLTTLTDPLFDGKQDENTAEKRLIVQSAVKDDVDWLHVHFYREWSAETVQRYVQEAHKYVQRVQDADYESDIIVPVMAYKQGMGSETHLSLPFLVHTYGSRFGGFGMYMPYWLSKDGVCCGLPYVAMCGSGKVAGCSCTLC